MEPRAERALFQFIFEVVMLEVGVNTGPSNVNLSPPTMIQTWWASFLQGQISQTMLQYVILAPCGTFFLRMKNQVLVHLMFPMIWSRRPILLDIPFLHFFIGAFREVELIMWFSRVVASDRIHCT